MGILQSISCSGCGGDKPVSYQCAGCSMFWCEECQKTKDAPCVEAGIQDSCYLSPLKKKPAPDIDVLPVWRRVTKWQQEMAQRGWLRWDNSCGPSNDEDKPQPHHIVSPREESR